MQRLDNHIKGTSGSSPTSYTATVGCIIKVEDQFNLTRRCHIKLNAGIDLHANNNYLAIIDENDTRVYKRKLPNQPDVILAELEPFKDNVSGIVVESTFNWYWLVDLLMDVGYCLHLANPAAIQKYKGLKIKGVKSALGL